MANIWSFEHDGLIGFPSRQCASTDAINALGQWIFQDSRRRFRVVTATHAGGVLVAELATETDDFKAGADLDEACAKYGIRRVQVYGGPRTVH